MNKQELIDAIAKESKLSKVDSKKALDGLTKSITKSLKKGEKVILVGYGTFSVVKRAARTGKNPRTGAAIKIPAKKAVKFKAGAVLAKAVEK
jgi:DNA-binding protein HU-beta